MQPVIIALAGNPNCGKTTLFNLLTDNQKTVGNWSGVTVAEQRGKMIYEQTTFEIVDLPGCYECSAHYNKHCAKDEYIAYQYLVSDKANIILNIVDATQLERHLILTLQLLEKKSPVIVALNLMDEAKQLGIEINIQKLSEELGCPVVPVVASRGEGINDLKRQLINHIRPSHSVVPDVSIEKPNVLIEKSGVAIENNIYINDNVNVKSNINSQMVHSFQKIQSILKHSIKKNVAKSKYYLSERIDTWVLNRFFSIPLFLFIMYGVFFITIDLGKHIQTYFHLIAKTIFIDKAHQILLSWQAPNWLIGLLSEGIGQGLYTTVTFIPIIALLYFCLGLLESSGYMARAAFIMDKFMQYMGLPGKSFVPLLLGFGCNVPAILAARTLENERERILTILMTPFMSCGARLAIFAFFVSAFFVNQGALIIFSLYLIGIMIALATGFFLQKTLLMGKASPLVMELPPYRLPNVRSLIRNTRFRVSRFIFKAGSLIIPLCALIGFCGSFNAENEVNSALESNFIKCVKTVTPIFKPMGLTEDNWPATVGLFSGIIAKEVVVGTLTALYANLGSSTSLESSRLEDQNLILLASENTKFAIDGAKAESNILGTMASRFINTAAAFAYLLFILLYFPCVSVIAVIARELNKRWAAFSVLWTTGIAYAAAVIFYQASTIYSHPIQTSCWIGSILGLGLLFFKGAQYYFKKQNKDNDINGFNNLKSNTKFNLKNKKLSTPIYINH